jgi:hypothetical protein
VFRGFSFALGSWRGCTLALDVFDVVPPGVRIGFSIETPDGQRAGGLNRSHLELPAVEGVFDLQSQLWLGGLAPPGTHRISLRAGSDAEIFRPLASWSAVAFILNAGPMHDGTIDFETLNGRVSVDFDQSAT